MTCSFQRVFAGLLLLLCVLPGAAWAGDVVIVLNARNPTLKLSVTELKAIYLGQTSFWHGVVPMKVLARPMSSKPSQIFLEGVLHTTPQKYERTWTAKQLAGQGIAPTELATADEVVTQVAANPGAIGFITAEEAWAEEPAGVKYVLVE